MRTLSIRTHLIILSAGIAAGMLAIGAFVTIPTVRSIRAVRSDIRAMRHTIEQGQARAARGLSLPALAKAQEDTRTFATALAQTGKELEIIRVMETVAEQTKIGQTLSIDTGPNGEYRLALTVSGSFGAIASYLRELERLPYYVVIRSIDWTRNRAAPGTIQARFDATIYAHGT